MFFPGVGLFLAGEHLKVSTDPLACGRGLNDVIHKACEIHALLFSNNTQIAAEASTLVLQCGVNMLSKRCEDECVLCLVMHL